MSNGDFFFHMIIEFPPLVIHLKPHFQKGLAYEHLSFSLLISASIISKFLLTHKDFPTQPPVSSFLPDYDFISFLIILAKL